jgi:pimeloyl-ACP methyl ester carboxylesterase
MVWRVRRRQSTFWDFEGLEHTRRVHFIGKLELHFVSDSAESMSWPTRSAASRTDLEPPMNQANPSRRGSTGIINALLAIVIALTSAAALAQQPYADAKAIIADMQRIVTPNGVQETFTARIGGIDQWINVRGLDRANPVLLFVHGGPASPAMPVSWAFQRPWEEYFTVVQWDQRGAGKTHVANDPEKVAPTIRIERFVEDAIEVIALLRERYGKRKVFVVGHSWGTIVGLQAALQKPEWVHAYVGIGQVISVRENERVSYEFALKSAREKGNVTAVRELESLAPYPGDKPLTRELIVTERKWAQHYGGLSAYRSDSTYYFKAPWLSPLYDETDVRAINQGSLLTLDRILGEWAAVDFRPVTQVPFPVVMFMGRHDYTTPSDPTAQWLAQVEAPAKLGVWFEHSSHLVPFEEPGKVLLALVQQVRPYASSGGRVD